MCIKTETHKPRGASPLDGFRFAQVVIGHVIFFVTNFNVPSQAVHVKITAIEGPIVFLILLYLWIRSRPLLLVHASR
jgi:hypothetical protein